MSNENQTVDKRETLAALRSIEELFVIASAATRLPFVVCDEETYDDEALLYYKKEDAVEKVQALAKENHKTGVMKVEGKDLLGFYTTLFTQGVNCLAVNPGTDAAINIQLTELVKRKNADEIPDGQKLVENPELQLTAMYFKQELNRLMGGEPTEEVRELQEELLAHYKKSILIVCANEDGKVPILKQKDGTVFQPVFTDLMECQKFVRDQKMKLVAFPAKKIPDILAPEVKGIAINPLGVNVQLQVNRPKKQTPASGQENKQPEAAEIKE